MIGQTIVSASRRTDLPAFYSPWLMGRIRAGYCLVANPRFPTRVLRVSLRPEDVLGFVFWTRHAAPLLPHLVELDRAGFAYYFQYTLTGYPASLEPRSPPLDLAIGTLRSLAARIGPERVVWRYDPIVFNRELDEAWHRERFRRLADALDGAIRRLVVSVIDPYVKTRRRIGGEEAGVVYDPARYADFLGWLAGECGDRRLPVQSCAEVGLDVPGILGGRCVDGGLLVPRGGRPEPPEFELHGLREGCLCHRSVDIGANDSCGFGCRYCYATTDHGRALAMVSRHRPEWKCLTRDIPSLGLD